MLWKSPAGRYPGRKKSKRRAVTFADSVTHHVYFRDETEIDPADERIAQAMANAELNSHPSDPSHGHGRERGGLWRQGHAPLKGPGDFAMSDEPRGHSLSGMPANAPRDYRAIPHAGDSYGNEPLSRNYGSQHPHIGTPHRPCIDGGG